MVGGGFLNRVEDGDRPEEQPWDTGWWVPPPYRATGPHIKETPPVVLMAVHHHHALVLIQKPLGLQVHPGHLSQGVHAHRGEQALRGPRDLGRAHLRRTDSHR